MKILYLGSKIPLPAHDGGSYASLQFIKQLSQLGTVDGIFIETQKHPLQEGVAGKLGNYFHRLEFQKLDTSIHFWGVISHLLRGKNYNMERFRSKAWESKLKKSLAANEYRLIIADSLYAAAQLFGMQHLPPLILRAHNIEHEIWQRQSEIASNPIKRWYLKQLSSSLKKEETALFHKATSIWTMSANDTQWIYKHLPQKNTVLIPIAIEEQRAIPSIPAEVFHLGSADWIPNQEAIQFLTTLFQDARLSNVPLNLAGKGMDSLSFEAKNIRNHGFVPDLNSFYSQAGILVTPIFSGSGIRVKILEAMSYGIPVITTSLGAAGIDVEQSGIVLAEDTESFIAAILKLIHQPEERKHRGQLGYAYIQQEHNFERVNQRIKHAIE
jgi:glycosyltransferase involved in cell wall biosynthesis